MKHAVHRARRQFKKTDRTWLTILTELIAGLAVLLGAFVTPVSPPPAVLLFVAIFTVHLPQEEQCSRWSTHQRECYTAAFCFGLEPTPTSISHSLTVAPITSGWSSCR